MHKNPRDRQVMQLIVLAVLVTAVLLALMVVLSGCDWPNPTKGQTTPAPAPAPPGITRAF